MIDTVPGRSVDFRHFVGTAFRGRNRVLCLALSAAMVLASGCTPRSAPSTVEDSLTSGRIRIACAPEARGLIVREVEAFKALYPNASFEIRDLNSRKAVAALFSAEAELAVVTRELTPDERAAAVRGGLELEGYLFARDAVVMLAHPGNPVENVALDDLRRVFAGEETDWRRLGGEAGAIETVVLPPEGDLTEYVSEKVLAGEPIRSRSRIVPDESAVIREVAGSRGALGFVSLGALDEAGDRARVLRVSSLTGLPYWKPDLEAVHHGDYPLTRLFSFYIRTDAPRLSAGLITFVTSRDGQALVHEEGLVPTAVPVRFVRRSPMVESH